MINLERGAFTLSYEPARVALEEMYQVIIDLGYSPGLEPPAAQDILTDGEAEDPLIESALKLANQEQKFVFVEFSAEWCLACQVLDELVFSDAAVQDALNDYVFVAVDTDAYPQTVSNYEVVGMPTLVILDISGEELFRSVGLIEADVLRQKLEELTAK